MKTFTGFVFVVMLCFLACATESLGQSARMVDRGGPMGRRAGNPSILPVSRHAIGDPLPAGTYTVGVAGSFATIDSAFKRLEAGGIAGPVTLLLTDTLYVAPFPPGDFRLIGPIAGAGPSSRITMRPADNVAVTIKGSGTATLTFQTVSYLTLDGVSLEGSTRLKIHTSLNTSSQWNDGIDVWGDCDHNIIANLSVSSDRDSDLPGAPAMWTSVVLLLQDDNGAPDSCLVSNVSVTSGPVGIYVGAGVYGYSHRPNGNVVRGCHIGSTTDSLISLGILIDGAVGTIVENNHVENFSLDLMNPSVPEVLGIECYYGSNTVIRDNVIHGLRGDGGGNLYGIATYGGSGQLGQDIQIYNNMIYDLRNKYTSTAGYIGGIDIWNTNNLLVAFNTVSLSGTSADPAGSDALALVGGVTNATILNNILVNTYHITSATGGCTALWLWPGQYFTSDHNDLLVDTTFANSNVVFRSSVSGYRTLSAWQGAGYDPHSVSVMPPFKSEQNPHLLYDTTQVADAAIPISGITKDIDGEPRPHIGHLAPDMGADEFDHPTGIADETELPSVYSLEQNYPNPFNPFSTIGFSIAESRFVTLKVYDILGREVATLVNEKTNPGNYEVKFDASALSSGVYFYRLTAGQYVECRKMVLMK